MNFMLKLNKLLVHVCSFFQLSCRAMMEPKLRPTPWPLFKFNQETIQLELQWASFSVSGVVTLETGPDVTEDSYEQTFYNTPCCGRI